MIMSKETMEKENTSGPYQQLGNNPSLTRNPAWGSLKLDPLPIYRDEERHQYCWEPTGEWLAYSTTRVTGCDKTPEQMANIERYRHIWEPRGVHVHYCLEQFLLGDAQPNPKEYKDWVDPLLSDPFWDNFETWAVEYMIADLEKSVGGQFDVLGYDHNEGKLLLIDLKTQSKSNKKTYNTDAQLGSYVEALANHHKIVVDACKTIWSRPNKCIIGEDQDPLTCRLAWHDSWEKFNLQSASF